MLLHSDMIVVNCAESVYRPVGSGSNLKSGTAAFNLEERSLAKASEQQRVPHWNLITEVVPLLSNAIHFLICGKIFSFFKASANFFEPTQPTSSPKKK